MSYWEGCYAVGGQIYCPGGSGPALPVGTIKRGETLPGGVVCGPGMRWDNQIARCVRMQKLMPQPFPLPIDPGGVVPDGRPSPPEQVTGGGQTSSPGGGLDIGGMLSGEVFGIPVMWIALGAAAYFLFKK